MYIECFAFICRSCQHRVTAAPMEVMRATLHLQEPLRLFSISRLHLACWTFAESPLMLDSLLWNKSIHPCSTRLSWSGWQGAGIKAVAQWSNRRSPQGFSMCSSGLLLHTLGHSRPTDWPHPSPPAHWFGGALSASGMLFCGCNNHPSHWLAVRRYQQVTGVFLEPSGHLSIGCTGISSYVADLNNTEINASMPGPGLCMMKSFFNIPSYTLCF